MTKIAVDCEFNGFGGQLISMALVTEHGDEWYTRGLPLAAFDGRAINRISKGKDAIAQRAVEHVAADDRPQTPRPGAEQ